MPQMTIPEIFRSITHTVTRVVGMVPASDYDDLVGELEDLKFDRAMSEAEQRRVEREFPADEPSGYRPPTAFNVGGKKFNGER